MARPGGQAKSQLASAQCGAATQGTIILLVMAGRGGTTSTIFRITSAKLMPIVVDVRAASDRRQVVQAPYPNHICLTINNGRISENYKLK